MNIYSKLLDEPTEPIQYFEDNGVFRKQATYKRQSGSTSGGSSRKRLKESKSDLEFLSAVLADYLELDKTRKFDVDLKVDLNNNSGQKNPHRDNLYLDFNGIMQDDNLATAFDEYSGETAVGAGMYDYGIDSAAEHLYAGGFQGFSMVDDYGVCNVGNSNIKHEIPTLSQKPSCQVDEYKQTLCSVVDTKKVTTFVRQDEKLPMENCSTCERRNNHNRVVETEKYTDMSCLNSPFFQTKSCPDFQTINDTVCPRGSRDILSTKYTYRTCKSQPAPFENESEKHLRNEEYLNQANSISPREFVLAPQHESGSSGIMSEFMNTLVPSIVPANSFCNNAVYDVLLATNSLLSTFNQKDQTDLTYGSCVIPSTITQWSDFEGFPYQSELGNNYDADMSVLSPQIASTKTGETITEKKKLKRGCRLWEFIRNLLLDAATNPSVIRWENRDEGTFRIVRSKAIAHMWGMKKGNGEMNYEKLSRAMRYYYKKEIFCPVIGQRLVYRFGPRATGWQENN